MTIFEISEKHGFAYSKDFLGKVGVSVSNWFYNNHVTCKSGAFKRELSTRTSIEPSGTFVVNDYPDELEKDILRILELKHKQLTTLQ